MDRARELDPLSPFVQVGAVWPLYFGRRYDEALARLLKIADLHPESANVHLNLARVYSQKRMYQEAIAELNKARELYGEGLPMASPDLGYAFAQSGNRDAARQIFGEMEERAKRQHVTKFDFAVVNAALGRTNEAIAWREDGYQTMDDSLVLLGVDPRVDSLRSDPRFIALLRRLKSPARIPRVKCRSRAVARPPLTRMPGTA
jgi:tetratricopeptide (TPR) repeat protein